MKSYGLSGQIDYDLGGAKLTAITAYRWWDWYPANDGDNLPISSTTKAQQQNFQRQFSQELRIASSGTHFIDWQAGLYYFWQVVRGYGATAYGADAGTFTLNPAAPGLTPGVIATASSALNGLEIDTYSDPRTRSYAAFGQIDVHLAEPLTLTAGLRFTHEDKTGSFSRFLAPGSGGDRALLIATLPAAQLPQFQATDLSFSTAQKSSAPSGLVTLGYKVTPDALVYATYSRGNKSGGLNVTAGGAGHTLIAPEKVDNFEIGLKSQLFDRTLIANVAAFLTNVRDYQANVSVPLGGVSFTQYISNIPKVRSKGVEADLDWSPSKWINLTASLAYTDAKYVNYTNAPVAPETAASGIQDLSGVALPGVSKWAYSFGADLSQPVDSTFEAYLHADWLHRSSFNSSVTNSAYAVVPAYGLLNGRIGLRTADGRYDFSLWARNLTNANYYVSRGASAFGLVTAAVGDPRTFGATLRVKI